jgi:hypothetical protein
MELSTEKKYGNVVPGLSTIGARGRVRKVDQDAGDPNDVITRHACDTHVVSLSVAVG